MNPCPIIPVLDLMIGQIVLATGGNRDAYQPVDTPLVRSSVPLDVAKAMFAQTGCDCLYLADIDSFSGARPNWPVFNELLDAGFGLWIDANWRDQTRGQQILEKINKPDRLKIILSSETMTSIADFDCLGRWIELGIRPIFSLDKKSDTVITQVGELSELSPLELVHHAYRQGVRELIVLDLESVGRMRGIVDQSGLPDLIHEIHQEIPELVLTSGGGIRDADDARELIELGCQHVLVASAIHQLRFTPDDVTDLANH